MDKAGLITFLVVLIVAVGSVSWLLSQQSDVTGDFLRGPRIRLPPRSAPFGTGGSYPSTPMPQPKIIQCSDGDESRMLAVPDIVQGRTNDQFIAATTSGAAEGTKAAGAALPAYFYGVDRNKCSYGAAPTDPNSQSIVNDCCVDAKTLNEGRCNRANNRMFSMYIRCENGCSNGACLTAPKVASGQDCVKRCEEANPKLLSSCLAQGAPQANCEIFAKNALDACKKKCILGY